ncbi:MAG: type IV pilin N-terminal domain-containing protein, partial [Methanofollis sp.]|uniref:type IV pilin N-terminal domain-containing protein n=1 Tax=Methanofollis sp. TaxID=2052835 RepID=UPI002634E732
MRQHRGEEGVSEVVGTILLVGLTVLAVAVVAVVFLSGPQPDEIPHATIVAGNKSGSLVLTHEGGDPLRAGEYRIYVDTGSGLVERTGDFSKPEGGIWSIGKSINYTGTETPRRVVVTVISGGSETILSEPAFVRGGSTFSPDPVEPAEPIEEPLPPFINFTIEENVFVYGTALSIGEGIGGGSTTVTGPGATVVITRGLKKEDLGGGGNGIAVSEIYINGSVILDGGSAGLGSAEEPGNIYVNGDLTLWNGQRHIYGDVYVNGDFNLKDAWIHGKVYVAGNLTLDNTPTIVNDARIYYTGALTTPEHYNSNYATNIVAKCFHQPTVPGFTMPDLGIPSTKSADWYAAKNYTSNGPLTDNKKIFAPSYSS